MDELRKLREVLQRVPDSFLMDGFDEAGETVMRVFLARVNDPEFQQHARLIPQVKAKLEILEVQAREKATEKDELRYKEKYRYDRTGRVIALIALAISILTLCLKIFGK